MYNKLISSNIILYCEKYDETARFYRDGLGLEVLFYTDWFVEFELTASSRLSIADDRRTSIKSCGGKGITIALQVEDIDAARIFALGKGLNPTEIKNHPWNARTFFITDPEGNRVEIWQHLSVEHQAVSGQE